MSSVAAELRGTLQNRSLRTSLLATAALLVALAIVSRVLYRFAQLDEAAYRSFSISIAALRSPSLLVLLIAPAGVMVWLRRDLRWSDIPEGRLVRTLVLLTAGSLAIHFAFYEPNWFLGQSHLVDRALLIGLLVVSWWRPIALLPFTILGVVIASQFAVPLGRYTWNDKRLVFDVVVLFCIAAAAGVIRRREGLRALIGAMGVLVVSWYLVAGAGKIALLWPGREELANMTAAAHLAGWLAEGTADGVVELLATLNWVLVPLTIAVEVAAVLLLMGRRSALAVLVATQGLHLAVFLVSGILFWKWMILEAALIVFFARCDRDTLASFGPALVILALPFAALSPACSAWPRWRGTTRPTPSTWSSRRWEPPERPIASPPTTWRPTTCSSPRAASVSWPSRTYLPEASPPPSTGPWPPDSTRPAASAASPTWRRSSPGASTTRPTRGSSIASCASACANGSSRRRSIHRTTS